MSQRFAFVGLMTILATVFGCVAAAIQIAGQPDIVFDLIKIGGVIAIGTSLVSYVVWSILHLRSGNFLKGGLSGFLTALVIVPLPVFASTLKNKVLASEGDLVISIVENLGVAVKTGFLTFEVVTKASLLAVIASVCLGVVIARFIPAEIPKGR